jgi:hypothetical protein
MNIESNGWFVDVEIMLMVRRFKAKIGEVETVSRYLLPDSLVKPLSIFEFVGNLIWYLIKEFKE